MLAKPELGKKTDFAFIKPLRVPGLEREAQPAGRRAVGTKLTEELETLLKRSMSELQENNQAQCRVFHMQEIASIRGDHHGQVMGPVISHSLTTSVLTDVLGGVLPSCEQTAEDARRWQHNLCLIFFCPNRGETRKKPLMWSLKKFFPVPIRGR